MFCKLSPDGSRFVEVAKALEEAGADGVTMFANNSILRIDVETGLPVNYGPCAGTGPWAKGQAMRWSSMVANETKLAVMGGRGATDWKDVVEFLMAGSSAVQMCSPIMMRGLRSVSEILDKLSYYMERHHYESVAEFQGKALKSIYSNQEMIDQVKALYAKINYDKCIGCGRCAEVCCYDAMTVFRKAVVKKDNCVGCSLCKNICPTNAIDMGERDNDLEYLRALSSAHPELAPEGVWDKE
jgi:ferredoxin